MAARTQLQTLLPIPSPTRLDPPVLTLQVNRRELHLLVEAMARFRELHCPLVSRGDWCPMLAAVEHPVTGALQRVCTRPCDEWLDELVGEVAGVES